MTGIRPRKADVNTETSERISADRRLCPYEESSRRGNWAGGGLEVVRVSESARASVGL